MLAVMLRTSLLCLFFTVGCADLANPRQTVLRPTGVITQPNEEGDLPPGSLSVGNNIRIRRQGVIEPRNSFENMQNLGLDDNDIRKLWELDDELTLTVREDQSSGVQTLYYQNGTQDNKINYTNLTEFEFSPGKTHLTKVRDRWIITNDDAPAVLDPEEFSGAFVARKAGLPQPVAVTIAPASGSPSGNVWEAGQWIGYRALFKLEREDGYAVRGAPSVVSVAEGAGSNKTPEITIHWHPDFPLAAGDWIEIYRVPQQATEAELGERFQLAFDYQLNSTDISNAFVELEDPCLDSALGAYLYTNSEQDGESKANWMPPQSVDVVTFKGATFYTAPTAWQLFTTRATNFVGNVDATGKRARGIGERIVNGDTVAGQPTITNVSAADIIGIEAGQIIDDLVAFPAGTEVISVSGVGPYTVTVNQNATSNFTGEDFIVGDVIEINGVSLYAGTATIFLAALADYNENDDGPPVVLSAGRVGGAFDDEGFVFGFANPLPASAPFTIRATNGQNFVPELPALNETAAESTDDPRTNRLFFSKIDQPEHVPPSNFLHVGQGTILKLWATQETLFAFCTDGIYRVDGDGDDWAVRPFDPDTVLLAPDAVDSIDNTIFAWTSAGFVSVTESGVQKISNPLIGEDIRELEAEYADRLPYSWNVQVAVDKHRSEVWFNFCDYEDDEGDVLTWIWNTDTNTFVTQTEENAIAVTYSPSRKSLLAGSRPGGGTVALRIYDDENFMVPTIVFNPVHADDLGNLKQWIDVTLFLEDMTAGVQIRPKFSGESYSGFYNLTTTSGSFEHVIAPVLNAVHSKHCEFGLDFNPSGETLPSFRLMGLSFRYRNASDTLRA